MNGKCLSLRVVHISSFRERGNDDGWNSTSRPPPGDSWRGYMVKKSSVFIESDDDESAVPVGAVLYRRYQLL